MIGRVGKLGLVLFAITLGLTACGGTRAGTVGDLPSDTPPPLTLYVSNQSFDDPVVGIIVTIDGSQVVDHSFEVEDQHNFVRFEQQGLTSGTHTIEATASTGPSFTTEVTIRDGEPRWAVLGYEFDPDEGQHVFSFYVSDQPIHFS